MQKPSPFEPGDQFTVMARSTAILMLLFSFVISKPLQAAAADPKLIVVIAGPKSHGPEGNGIHDYGWSARLIKAMLQNSNVRDQVRAEAILGGWPKDQSAIEKADTLVIISDGRDGDQFRDAPHLESDERVAFVDRQMKRGCGMVTFHFSTFTPQKYADRVIDWTGGYFQWETDGQRKWYSAIATIEADVALTTPEHPVGRGVRPFRMKEEFYYNLRFAEGDAALTPLWRIPALPGRAPDGNIVAWARQRPDGGRGFGTSCGHFYENWRHDDFRKLLLNAIVWTAHGAVPDSGVDAPFLSHEQIDKALAGPATQTAPAQ